MGPIQGNYVWIRFQTQFTNRIAANVTDPLANPDFTLMFLYPLLTPLELVATYANAISRILREHKLY